MKFKVIENIDEYVWETTLEEDIAEYYAFEEPLLESKAKGDINVGDIIFVNLHEQGGHRILVVVKVNGDTFSGCLMSSNTDKANVNNEKYPNNILVKNYNTILDGNQNISSKDAIVKTDQLIDFSLKDLSKSGWFKGKVNDDFLDFIETCVIDAHLGKEDRNRNRVWDVSAGH